MDDPPTERPRPRIIFDDDERKRQTDGSGRPALQCWVDKAAVCDGQTVSAAACEGSGLAVDADEACCGTKVRKPTIAMAPRKAAQSQQAVIVRLVVMPSPLRAARRRRLDRTIYSFDRRLKERKTPCGVLCAKSVARLSISRTIRCVSARIRVSGPAPALPAPRDRAVTTGRGSPERSAAFPERHRDRRDRYDCRPRRRPTRHGRDRRSANIPAPRHRRRRLVA